jgi:hypothetical protein
MMKPSSALTASTSSGTSVLFRRFPAFRDPVSEGDTVQKDELLHLHMLMYDTRMYFEFITRDEICTKGYNSLEISPSHIHKDKKAHKDAILTLGEEIVFHIKGKRNPG